MQNLFIESLAAADRAHLLPMLQHVTLPQKKILFETGQNITKAYFPTSGIISIVSVLATGAMIEIAMVGRDGMAGGSSVINGKRAVSRAIVQVAGEGFVCNGAEFKALVIRSPSLHSRVIKHEQALFVQAQQAAVCNASHDIKQRLARWILRARDLVPSKELPFTHEFLAEMLGVRRSSVSIVAAELQKMDMIAYHRGHLQIVDLAAIKVEACECYASVREHYKELLG